MSDLLPLKAAPVVRSAIILLCATVTACAAETPVKAACDPGIYNRGEEKAVLYARTQENGDPVMRYTFVSGWRGVLGDEGAILECASGVLSSAEGVFERVFVKEQDTVFQSGALNLKGRLITPDREVADVRPLVVFVHGSEATPTVGYSYYPYILAAQGVSVFVYDKRGTGQSEGEYNQDFHALAGDAVAAAKEAKRMAGASYDRFGFFGGSQGGWVAPLAAMTVSADFLVVGFGLVLAPLEEDAEQVYDEMRRAGYSDDDIEKAREVTKATGEIVASHFEAGFENLTKMKTKYTDEPWLTEIEGEFTGDILRASDAELRGGGPDDFDDADVPWRHDAMAVLRSLSLPQLWVIAGEDTAAPGALTRQRLATLQQEGLPITTALFPGTDHGMVEFIEAPDGSRHYTHFTEGYFRLITDYMKGDFSPPYGRAEISGAPD